jgi:chromosomal replication initiator protein
MTDDHDYSGRVSDGSAQPAPPDSAAATGAWIVIREQLRQEFGARTFSNWLRPLTFAGLDGATAVLTMPTGFQRDWVRSHYAERLRSLWAVRAPGVTDVRFSVAAAVVEAPGSAEPAVATAAPTPAPLASAPPLAVAVPAQPVEPANANDGDWGAPLDSRLTFERFVVGKSNEFAYTAALRVANGGSVTFNPLFLHSSVGLGKTHLMHAIAWEIRRQHPGRRVIYMSAEKFMFEFVSALRYKDMVSFKQRFRNVDVLMIDDVQFIAHKNSTQDEFFHTINALIDYKRQLVISADRSPSDLEGIEERIRSRLNWGLVADIHPTDYELRLGILQSRLETMSDVIVPQEVTEFLARRIVSNVRELEGALNRVAAQSTLIGRPVTLDLTRQVLSDMLRSFDRKTTMDEIQRKVADHYNVRLQDLLSARRSREIARPRQVAMYLAKRLTPRSLPEIGRKFGGRDHTTVMHAIKRIEELRATDSELDADLTHLTRLLDS